MIKQTINLKAAVMNKQFTLNFQLSPDATYENYVGIAAGKIQQFPDWQLLWGSAGSGKSHLLQAACHGFDQAIYLSDLPKLSPEILQDLEQRPLICIDDIDSVVGDSAWEEALFHLMNGVRDQKRRLVLSAREPAKDLDIKLKDLKSRLLSAQAVRTDELSDDEKIQLLIRRSNHWGFELSEDVGRFILSRSPRNVNQLLDMLKRLELETLRLQKRVTIPFVKQTLEL